MQNNQPSGISLGDFQTGCFVNSIAKTSWSHDIFIDKPISEPADYREALSILYGSTPEDEVTLIINSVGGGLDAAMSVVDGIKQTQAEVVAIITGPCHSAASIIALNSPKVVIMDNAYMMVHTASFGPFGNAPDVKAQTEFTLNQIERIIDSTYTGFLTPEEIQSVKDGKSFWFDAEEIKVRLQNKADHLKALRPLEVADEEVELDCCGGDCHE